MRSFTPNMYLTAGEAQNLLDLADEYEDTFTDTLVHRLENVVETGLNPETASEEERAIRVFDLLREDRTFYLNQTVKVQNFIDELGLKLMDVNDPGFTIERRRFFNSVLAQAARKNIRLPRWAWVEVTEIAKRGRR